MASRRNDMPSRNTSKSDVAGSASAASSTIPPARPSMSSTRSTLIGSSPANEKGAAHQRFVFTDPVALRYLEEDSATTVLARRHALVGYEVYLVEQWACSRTHPTFMITTYTGDDSSRAMCGVLSVPSDRSTWSPRLKVYFDALDKYHAKPRETSLGTLMITNLSAFPSSLTVIAVPEGDPTKYREDFYVNEDLKRLGCSGRMGLTLAKPTSSTVSKFYQLYRASDKIPLGQAVVELVKLCQVALMLFDKLEPEYADGLLCDLTEKALNDWWLEFGTDFYNIEPHDGILGPTTVAALLGLLMGARNRLNAFGAPVSKDVFDIEHTKRAIAYFQKSHRLPKTRRLDHATLAKLHRATARAANSEGWAVPRAIKGTVAELGGKGGEMVMDMVGARDKSGITEVETCDIEQFALSVGGARAKWLWLGKPRKGTSSGDMFNRLASDNPMEFQGTEDGGYEWSSKRKESTVESPKDRLARSTTMESNTSRTGHEERHRLTKKHVSEKEPHKETDSGRGLGRIKDAVGLRSHPNRQSRDDSEPDRWRQGDSSPRASPCPDLDSSEQGRHRLAEIRASDSDSLHVKENMLGRNAFTDTPPFNSSTNLPQIALTNDQGHRPKLGAPIDFEKEFVASSTASVADSTYHGVDLDDILPAHLMPGRNTSTALKRRHSLQGFPPKITEQRNQDAWPRRISFSIAEESILTWVGINDSMEQSDIAALPDLVSQLRASKVAKEDARCMRQKLLYLESTLSTWAQNSVSSISRLENLASRDQETLDGLYYPRLEEHHAMQEHAQGALGQEKSMLEEAIREIEVLGAKLEYEINALKGKVDDVEDGVEEFGRQVRDVEGRVQEMEDEMQSASEGWIRWLLRKTLGIKNDVVDEAADDTSGGEKVNGNGNGNGNGALK